MIRTWSHQEALKWDESLNAFVINANSNHVKLIVFDQIIRDKITAIFDPSASTIVADRVSFTNLDVGTITFNTISFDTLNTKYLEVAGVSISTIKTFTGGTIICDTPLFLSGGSFSNVSCKYFTATTVYVDTIINLDKVIISDLISDSTTLYASYVNAASVNVPYINAEQILAKFSAVVLDSYYAYPAYATIVSVTDNRFVLLTHTVLDFRNEFGPTWVTFTPEYSGYYYFHIKIDFDYPQPFVDGLSKWFILNIRSTSTGSPVIGTLLSHDLMAYNATTYSLSPLKFYLEGATCIELTGGVSIFFTYTYNSSVSLYLPYNSDTKMEIIRLM